MQFSGRHRSSTVVLNWSQNLSCKKKRKNSFDNIEYVVSRFLKGVNRSLPGTNARDSQKRRQLSLARHVFRESRLYPL